MNKTDLRILAAFPPPPGETYGRELSVKTGYGAGTVMVSLYRLERQDALISSRWEDAEVARADRRPPRRLYRLTDAGLRERFENRDTPGRVGVPGRTAPERA